MHTEAIYEFVCKTLFRLLINTYVFRIAEWDNEKIEFQDLFVFVNFLEKLNLNI